MHVVLCMLMGSNNTNWTLVSVSASIAHTDAQAAEGHRATARHTHVSAQPFTADECSPQMNGDECSRCCMLLTCRLAGYQERLLKIAVRFNRDHYIKLYETSPSYRVLSLVLDLTHGAHQLHRDGCHTRLPASVLSTTTHCFPSCARRQQRPSH